MKKLNIAFVIVLLVSTQLISQDAGRGNAWIGRTYDNRTPRLEEQAILRQADYLFNTGDLEGAYFALEEGFAQNPYSSQILLERAFLKRLMGMNKEARQDIQMAQKLNPYAADLFGYNGGDNIMTVLSSDPKAATTGISGDKRLGYYYQAIDKEYSETSGNTIKLEPLEELMIQIESKEYDAALVTAEQMTLEHPNSAIAYDLYGVILLKMGSTQEAKTAFEKATQLDPSFALAWYNLGRAETQLGEYTIAQTHMNNAIELQDDLTKAYFDRALLKKKTGNPEEALEDYNKIIKMKGRAYPEAYLNRGLTRKMLGDFEGALQDINYVINSQDIEEAEPYLSRGNLHMVFGYTEKATADYTKVIQLQPDNAKAYYNRGLAYLLIYDNASSCADLEKSKELGFEPAEEMLLYFCGN